jgi:hypothetical protein
MKPMTPSMNEESDEPYSVLDSVNDRLASLNDYVSTIGVRAANLSDRLFQMPREVNGDPKALKKEASGIIGEIETRLDVLMTLLRSLDNEVSTLSRL